MRFLVVSSCLLVLAAFTANAARGVDGDEGLLQYAQAPDLDAARGVRIDGVEVDMGPGKIVFGDGVLVPAGAISGRTFELAFVGHAIFRIDPEDPIESYQLDQFAAAPLITTIDRAVLVVGDAETARRLLDAGEATSLDAERLEEATNLFEEWADGPQRKGFGVAAAIVKAAAGEPRAAGYFSAWCRSPELGTFHYSVDPARAEQVSLGQFVPMSKSLLRTFRRYSPRMKWTDPDLLGHWDTWVSMPLHSATGEPTPGSSGFESEHYVIDLSVDPRYVVDAWGETRVRARAVSGGHRSIDFSLYSGLRVKDVTGADDRPLPWIRSRGQFTVLLPEAVPQGEEIELRVEYEGDLIEKYETYEASRDKPFRLLSTGAWYPRVGSIDRATYDVTLHAPKLFDVVGSGALAESGEDDEGLPWQRHTLDVPAIAFTFEIGRFDFVQDRVGHIALTFAFPRHRFALREDTRQRIIDGTKASLIFFEEKFGAYPLDHLTVVTVQRGFSQGYLSFVSLAEGAMRDPLSGRKRRIARPEWSDEYRDLTVSHEVSHQWWGNWVGWDSYRDQWLSEALAEYSSLLFGASRSESQARFLARNAVDWRGSLRSGVESQGPVTLGVRLKSSKGDAYRAVVYDKGSVVIRMLARMLGDEPFSAMLGALAKRVANRVIDTPTFLAAMEKMSGRDLDPFAQQFIYGTGIPNLYYRYEVDQAEDGDGWILHGQAYQAGRGDVSYALRYDNDRGWWVESEFESDPDTKPLSWVVPFQIVVTPPGDVDRSKKKKREVQSARGFGGSLNVQGAVTEFEYRVPQHPERMDVDQFGEVLARFYDEGLVPKHALWFRGRRLARSGELDEAAEVLRQALAAPMYSERGLAWLRPGERYDEDELKRQRERRDADIHALLARVHIEQDDLDEARRELAAVEELAPKKGTRSWNQLRILSSRIELASGEYEAAFERLKHKKNRRMLGAEGYCILAAAAQQTGHDRIVEELIDAAEKRGANMAALRSLRAVETAAAS